MARKPDIQYVGQFYTYGSEARQPAPQAAPEEKTSRLPKFLRQEKIKVYVDPVALCGLVVAVAMLVLMAVSARMVSQAYEEYQVMESYVLELQDSNARLNHEYHNGYDLDYVEQTALALGMVPIDTVQTFRIESTLPEPEPEPTLWEDIQWFFEGLFA